MENTGIGGTVSLEYLQNRRKKKYVQTLYKRRNRIDCVHGHEDRRDHDFEI